VLTSRATEVEVERLANVPVFGALSPDELAWVVELAEVWVFEADETVVSQGALAQEMFVVLEGEVEVVGESEGRVGVLGRLASGDCFGEMSLLDIQPRSATVRSTGHTRLLVVGFDDLGRIQARSLQTYTLLLMNVGREVSRRLRVANRRLAEHGYRSLHDA
jgi:CRP-like cAMP-binding protein